MSQSNSDSSEGWAKFFDGLAWVGWLVLMAIMAAWIASQWLTRMFFIHVLNKLLNGALDRNDGLVVLCATAIWLVFGWVSFPIQASLWLTQPTQEELIQFFLSATLFWLVWGASIGAGLVLTWWNEAEEENSGVDFAQVAGIPSDFYQPVLTDGQSATQNTADELEQMILGVEWDKDHA